MLTTEGESDKKVAAYDRSDGSLAWRTDVASNVSLTQTSFGEKRVYYGYGSTMDALNVSDGTTAWSREFEQGLPFVFELFGTPYLFGQGKVAELSSQNGSEVWALTVDGFPFPNALVGYDEDAEQFEGFVVSTRSTIQQIDLEGTREWTFETEDTENFSRAEAVGGLVYAADGSTLLELDGGETTWTYDNDGTALGAVKSDDERVYAYDTGTIHAFKLGVEGAETTTPDGGETTTAGGGTTTAGSGGTTAPGGGTTATVGTDAGTTAEAGDDDSDSDGGSDGSPGFGVLTAVAAALLAATRLLGDDDEE